MKLCLDTNIYSAFKNGNQKIIDILENADEVLIPVTVLGELYSGFQIGSLTEKNLTELDKFLSKPGISIIEINKDIALRYGFITKELRKQGTPIPTNDIWIASSAMDTGSILLSSDKHFKEVPGLMVLDF
ncbi:MAG: type II toxin-antitoxin system VapC family toxin [Spirochaetia bacterium]|jgi:tRNA(fMet)-specific endonuclease VapC|nr:type II toxin-antitoxin system VapC family toxin [Spirochaetia bacterium]